MPGNTAWDTASPISDQPFNTKNDDNCAAEIDTTRPIINACCIKSRLNGPVSHCIMIDPFPATAALLESVSLLLRLAQHLKSEFLHVQVIRISENEVALCHTREYIDTVKMDVLDAVPCLSTGDTDVSERSFEVALKAVGGVLDAVDSVVNRELVPICKLFAKEGNLFA